jgi:uncharacterized RDD family membrane protein YckC
MSQPTPTLDTDVGELPPVWWTPPPPVLEIPGAPGLTFADLGSRVIAFLVDSLIVGIIGAALLIALGFGERVETPTSVYVWVPSAAANVAYALLGFAYFTFFWTGGRRATIGQRVLKIQVGNAFDGRSLTVRQAVQRWLGYGSVLGLLAVVPTVERFAGLAQFGWALVLLVTAARSRTKQGLHDRFAHSALVRPAQRSGGLAAACLIVLILIVLVVIAAVAALIVLGSQIGPLTKPPGTTI